MDKMMGFKRSYPRLLLTILIYLIQGCINIQEDKLVPTDTIISPNTLSSPTKIVKNSTIEATLSPSNPTSPIFIITTSNLPTTTSTTPTHTNTMTPTPLPTITPLPTVSSSKVQAYLRDLILNNDGCRLPCWWGISPGITNWQFAQQFLETFSSGIYQNKENFNIYNVNYGTVQNGYIFGTTQYYVNNGTVISIVVGPTGIDFGYKLNQLLTNYGEPDSVNIYTYPYYLSHGQLPFYLFLRYEKVSITAIYEYEADIREDKIRACPASQPIGPWLILGQIQNTLDIQSYPLQSLYTATSIDVADFYQTYLDAHSHICLRTPINIWKWP